MTAAERATARAEHGAPPPPDPFQAELERALADVRAALGTDKATRRAPLFSVDAASLLGEEFPDPQWLVTGLLTRGSVGIIGGPPKIARKTWLASEIAVAIVTGSKVCCEFYAAAGRVAYFYAEDTRRQVRNRFRALLDGAGRRLPPGNLHLEPAGEFLDITRDEDLARIIASARRIGPLDLLVLDPLRDIHSAAEDKSDEMSPVMRRLRLLAQLLGCTVLVVHHSAKPSEATAKRSGGQQLRGSTAIHGAINSGGIYMSECGGDGQGVFTNTIESEVKGARSAGRFQIELRIEDDDSGEAIRATWVCSRDEGKRATLPRAAQDAADDERVYTFVRELAMRGEILSRRKLREHDDAPLADKAMRAALDRLITVGRLRLEGSKVVIPGASQGDES